MTALPERALVARPPARRGWRAALVAVAGLALAGAAAVWLPAQIRARADWRAARIALEDRDFPRAQAALRRCLDAWPRDPASHFELARALRRAGRFEDAAPLLDRAEQLGWPHRAVELEQLLQLAQAGRPAPLLEGLAGLGYDADEDRLIREALVVGYLQLNYLDRAYRVTTKWVEDRPGDWQGHFWTGRALERGLQFALAADAYGRALALRPGHPELLRSRGEAFLRRGRFAEAAADFGARLEADPADAAARLGLARGQRALHPPAVARATLGPLLTDPAPPPEVCLLAGQLDLDEDRPAAALPWLRRAAEQDPANRDAPQALAEALRRLNRPDEARVFEEKAAALTRDYKRLEQITEAVTQTPRDAALRCEAGTILLRLGQPAAAAQWLLSALALDPAHAPTRRALAECLPRLGDPRLTDYCRHVLASEDRRQ